MVNTRISQQNSEIFLQSLNSAIANLGAKFNVVALPKNEENIDLSQVNWMDVKSLEQAEQKAIQEPLVHPFFLIVEWLFRAVCYKISTWWHQETLRENREILLYCHSLRNHGHLSAHEFVELDKSISNKDELRRLTTEHIQKLKDSGFIDIKAHRAISGLLIQDKLKEVWIYLNTISALNNLTAHIDKVKEILGPKESLELLNILDQASKTSIFDGEAIFELNRLLARIEIAFWLDSLEEDNILVRDLKKDLRNRDEKTFQQDLKLYFEYMAEKEHSHPLRKYYYEDMYRSLDFLIGQDAFIHLSHAFMTESFMQNWQEEFSKIHKAILALDSINHENIQDFHLRLVKLYEIFGHVLEGEKDYIGSKTLYAEVYGKLKQQWQDISDKMHQFNKKELSSHDFCGCINQKLSEVSSRPWPSTATNVIKANHYEGDHHKDVAYKKKVMCVTCSWGGGHRAVASALEQYLGSKDFHFTAIDGPQEILISQDLLQQHLGRDYTITKLYNTLVANSAWRTLNFIKQFTSSAIPTEIDPDQKRLMMQRVLMEKPDVIVAAYSQHVHLLTEIGKELGIPVVYVSTDLHQHYPAWYMQPEYEHFKMIVPSTEEAVMETFNAPVPRNQVLGLGYPIRPAFSEEYNQEDLETIYDKFNLPKDKKLILIMAGACGAESPYTEKILRNMEHGKYQDCHLVVVCGNNKPYFESLSQEIKDRNLKAHASALGFISSGEDMAKLMHVSDCLVTKPGGSSVAEAVSTHLKLVLEVNSNTFEWEKFAADWVVSKGIGTAFHSNQEFFEALDSELNKEKPSVNLNPKQPQEKGYLEAIKSIIKKAEKDKELQNRRQSWQESFCIPYYKPIINKGYRMETAQADFNRALKDKALSRKIFIRDGIINSLLENKPVQINFKTGFIEEAKVFSEGESLLLIQKLSKYFEELSQRPLLQLKPQEERLFFVAKLLLVQLDKRYASGEISKKSLEEEIAQLDRLCTLISLKSSKMDMNKFSDFYQLSDDENSRKSLKNISRLYTTSLAKKEFKKWYSEKTSHGRKKNLEEYILTPKAAALSYIFHPASVGFVKSLHIHRNLSALNEKLPIDQECGDLIIRLEGKPVKVSAIINDFQFYQNRILDKEGREFFYFDDQGLREGSPSEWQEGEIPVFKQKNKTRKSHYLEICTVMSPDETHSYIKLKTKDGKVYSVGKFWDRHAQPPGYSELLKTVPAMLAMDYHDYKPHEAYSKKTKVELTDEKFNEIFSYITELQKNYKDQDGGYNLINSNCTGFVKQIAKKAGIEIDSKISLVEYLSGGLVNYPSIRKFLYRNNWLRNASNIILYPFALFRNLLIFFLGGKGTIGSDNLKKDAAFKSFFDLIDPLSGYVNHPIGIRTWQEIVEEQKGLKT